MPPKAQKESLVLLINIGITNPNIENNHSLLEKAKHIAKRKIQKMIFLTPKDEVAIMLMGSGVTKNRLGTEHVEEFTDFQIPNWDLVKKCMGLKGTNHCSNWIEALEAAVLFMKENTFSSSTRKIILMSDFNEDPDIISQFQADAIVDRLSTNKIILITLSEATISPTPTHSEALLKDVNEKINGHHITFDNVISDMKFYTPIPSKPFPSYYSLELLDKKIPVVSYAKVRTTNFPSWKKAKGNQKLRSETKYLDRQRVSYTADNIQKGYKYGADFISVPEGLERNMRRKDSERSYRIYGFTDRNNVDLEYFYKSSSSVILPNSETNNVVKPFYSLVQAMHETNSVAIVRKIYKKGGVPRMVALFPCIDIPDEPWCLIEIQLVFAEDRRIMETRSMKSTIKQLNTPQNEAIDGLIDSLMLTDTENDSQIDGCQCFLPGCMPNPGVQHRWDMLSYRAINPDKPLPPVENYLKETFEIPSIKKRSKCHLQKIAELFRLESINPKKEKSEMKQQDNMQVNEDIDIDTEESNKTEDIADVETNLYKESVLSLDISDIDLDELAANI